MNSGNILVAHATTIDQATFYKKTYQHVAIAILAFVGVETLLFKIVPPEAIIWMFGGSYRWLLIIGIFWFASSFSEKMVFAETRDKQYMGLGLAVILQAVIFLPMIYMAIIVSNGGLDMLMQAAAITLFMFAGLTAAVFFTKTDFSFLRTALMIGGFVSFGTIIIGQIFGFNLGLWFSVGMVVLASGSILYQTSQIKDHFGTEQYVGASLKLFASIMLLFWYILRILISRRR
jgi:FtsH-binding integral membrane protein